MKPLSFRRQKKRINCLLRKPSPKRRRTGARSAKASKAPRKTLSELPNETILEIIKYLDPRAMARIGLTGKRFHDFVEDLGDKEWKVLRENCLDGYPDPMLGMSERTYCSLLFGRGCQKCGNSANRKVYWPFRKRWCTNCLHERYMRYSILFLRVLRWR